MILLFAPVGCENRDEQLREEVTEEVGGELDTSMTQVMDQEAEPEVQVGATAAVVIDENTIGIEQELEPGLTLFTIRNSGLKEHSFAMSGPGGEWQLESALAPEESGSLEVNLEEGTYTVFDPQNEALSTEVVVGAAAAPAE